MSRSYSDAPESTWLVNVSPKRWKQVKVLKPANHWAKYGLAQAMAEGLVVKPHAAHVVYECSTRRAGEQWSRGHERLCGCGHKTQCLDKGGYQPGTVRREVAVEG